MNLADILKDKELKEELLEILAPPRKGGRTLGLVGPFDARAPKAELRALVENPARPGRPPLLGVDEAIVLRYGRPVLFIRGNSLQEQTFEDPESQVWSKRLRAAQKWLTAALPAVGRIELRDHPEYTWVGTGWLVAPGVVVTNRHVADVFVDRGTDQLVFRRELGRSVRASINFRAEYLQEEEHEFRLPRPLHVEGRDGPDLAFFQVHPQSDLGEALGAPPIDLAAESPTPGQEVAVIGYPGRDDRRNDPWLADLLFTGVYGVKRLAPGKVGEAHPDYFTHDCSTLGGNSGSVVLDLATGKAVGIHFAGSYREANYAVPAARLAERLAALPRP
jgi:endonuclease G